MNAVAFRTHGIVITVRSLTRYRAWSLPWLRATDDRVRQRKSRVDLWEWRPLSVRRIVALQTIWAAQRGDPDATAGSGYHSDGRTASPMGDEP
jgi:hypothetical protein